MTSGDLEQMSDAQLLMLADEIGVPLPTGTPRGVILTQLIAAAEAVHDG